MLCNFRNSLVFDRDDEQIQSRKLQICPTIDALGIDGCCELKGIFQLSAVDLTDVQATCMESFTEVRGDFACAYDADGLNHKVVFSKNLWCFSGAFGFLGGEINCLLRKALFSPPKKLKAPKRHLSRVRLGILRCVGCSFGSRC